MKIKTSISLKDSHLERLRKIAKKEKRSVSQVVEIALDGILKGKPRKRKIQTESPKK